jgi:DNA polymerase-3 subunit delta
VPKAKAKTAESESNIHAIVGSDESEVKRVASELAAKLAPPDAGELGVEVIDACADNVDQAVSRIR